MARRRKKQDYDLRKAFKLMGACEEGLAFLSQYSRASDAWLVASSDWLLWLLEPCHELLTRAMAAEVAYHDEHGFYPDEPEYADLIREAISLDEMRAAYAPILATLANSHPEIKLG